MSRIAQRLATDWAILGRMTSKNLVAATQNARADRDLPLNDLAGSLADAERMLVIADGLSDVRIQRMRSDQKQTLGAALKVPKAERGQLERAEGKEAWVIIKPGAELRRDMFGGEALKPLLVHPANPCPYASRTLPA
jgi:hypothetical protein